MEGGIRLSRDEAQWLFSFSEGYAWEPDSNESIPTPIADRLVSKGLLCRDHGWLDITYHGMVLAQRCTVFGDHVPPLDAPYMSPAA